MPHDMTHRPRSDRRQAGSLAATPNRDPILAALGRSVRRHREARGISQAKLADLDRACVSDIERGNRNPGIENVARLAKAHGITTAELSRGVAP